MSEPEQKIDLYQCDRTLFLSLVYDAKATDWFHGNLSASSSDEKGKDMKQRFGLSLVFVATRSGLTRWQDISVNSESDSESENEHFSEAHNRAIDETWYKRAVEQYFVDPQSFVYSVPFDAGDENETLVTATNAIFHTDGSRQAPAAVVGFQFHHSALHTRFMNITSTCDRCEKTCAHTDLDCFILDNNGYVVISEDRKDTGKFFGEIKGNVMESLVEDNIYKRIEMFDYQAVCFRSDRQEPSNSNRIYTSLTYLCWFINWTFTQVIWMTFQMDFNGLIRGALPYPTGDIGVMYSENYDDQSEPTNPETNMKTGERLVFKMMINRTRPQPCDMQVGLYLLEPPKKTNQHHHNVDQCARPYVVQNIPFSNLVMVVINKLCKIPDIRISVLPDEISYNSSSLSCHKVMFNKLPRRRPKECIKSHPKEKDIKLCGKGSTLHFHALLCGLHLILYFIKLGVS